MRYTLKLIGVVTERIIYGYDTPIFQINNTGDTLRLTNIFGINPSTSGSLENEIVTIKCSDFFIYVPNNLPNKWLIRPLLAL